MVSEISVVRLAIKTQQVRKNLTEIISSCEGFRLQKPGDQDVPALLILELGDDLQREFQLINSIQTSGATMDIFVTSSRAEPDILIRALREGVKEFFSQPIRKEEVMNALSKFTERKAKQQSSVENKKRGKILNVIGGKGGVGATTVAVNLATSLAESEGSPLVALIDMNLLFGEVPLFLGVKSLFNLAEVARNVSRLDSTYLMSILSKHVSGVYVLSSPTGLEGADAATPEIMERLLSVMQSVFDFIVIDGSQSLDQLSLKILEVSNFVLLVAILSLPCLTNLKRLLWTFEKLGYSREENIKIIVNRYHKKSVISLRETEEALGKKVFWPIPNDYSATMSAINQGKPLSMTAPEAEVNKSIRELAFAFLGKEKTKKENVRFWGFFA
jgi:pilus assembly protein CpaE